MCEGGKNSIIGSHRGIYPTSSVAYKSTSDRLSHRPIFLHRTSKMNHFEPIAQFILYYPMFIDVKPCE